MAFQKTTKIEILFPMTHFFRFFFIIAFSLLYLSACNTKDVRNEHDDFYNALNGLSDIMEYDLDSTIGILDSLIVVAVSQKDPLMIAWTHILYGQAYSNKDFNYLAIDHYKKALIQLELTNDLELKSMVLNNLAMAYSYNNQTVEAIEAFESMLEIAGLTNAESVYHFGLMNLANLNTKIRLFDVAIRQNMEALSYFKGENDSTEIAICLLNNSEIAQAKGDLDTAINYMLKVLQICPATDTIGMWGFRFKLSQLYLENGQYEDAMRNFILLDELESDFLSTYDEALKTEFLGDFYRGRNDIAVAIAKYDRAYDLFEQSESLENQQNMLRKIIQTSLDSDYTYLVNEYYPIYDSLHSAELQRISRNRAEELSSLLHMNMLADSLDEERFVNKQRSNFILYMSILLFFLILVIILGSLYHIKLKRLYKVLYNKNIETIAADNHSEPEAAENNKEQVYGEGENNTNLLLFRFSKLIVDKAIFTDPNLTLKQAASMLGTNERYLSFAINQGTNSNFNAYLNKYRIRVAQGMLLNPKYRHYTLEAIAEEVGFANRQTFFRVFKQMSGLNPTQFREFSGQKKKELLTSHFAEK